MTRQKEDYNAITFDLFKTKGLSFKLKTKIYNEHQLMDGTTIESFFHKEYVYNKGKTRASTIALTTKSYIQVDVFDSGANTKNLFFMNEALLNKFIRKNSNIVMLLEAADDNEIELVSVDASGTHINNKLPKSASTIMGRSKILSEICIMEDKCSVGVQLQFDTFEPVTIPSYIFLELYYTIKDINFTSCGIALLTYLGTAQLGTHEQDFRESGVVEKQNIDIAPVQKFTGTTMSEFNSIKNSTTLKPISKINW